MRKLLFVLLLMLSGAVAAAAPSASPLQELSRPSGPDSAPVPRMEVALLRRQARAGDAESQYALGLFHLAGVGVPLDDGAAKRWFEQAARQYHASAQYRLGLMYHQGGAADGVREEAREHELREALRWYRLAAHQDHAGAQSNLGLMHYQGLGVERDAEAALDWYLRAARQGHAEAQYNLGLMHYQGGAENVGPGDDEAFRWLQEAARQDYPPAQYLLGEMYAAGRLGKPDETEALRWIQRAARLGHARAQYLLGVMYYIGQGGLPRDPGMALQWYTLAAERGNSPARHKLGLMYYRGRDVERDAYRAYLWLGLAAGAGYEKSVKVLDQAAELLTPGQLAEARREIARRAGSDAGAPGRHAIAERGE